MEEEKTLTPETEGTATQLFGKAVIPVQPVEKEQKSKYFNAPSGQVPKMGLLALGTHGEEDKLDILETRITNVSHAAATFTHLEEEGTISILYETSNTNITISFPSGIVSPVVRKLYQLFLIKANEQCLDNGRVYCSVIRFPLQDLVDLGVYDSVRSARRGYQKAAEALQKTKILIKSADGSDFDSAYLFPRVKLNRGICTVKIDEDFPWGKHIANYYTQLPSYAFALSPKASDLTTHIVYQARQQQNMRSIKENGYFLMSLKSVEMYLHLPLPDGDTNASRKVKGKIQEVIKEINEANFPDEEIRLEIIDNSMPGSTVKEYIENGKLKVNITGDLASYFNRLEDDTREKIERKSYKKKSKKSEKNKC